MTQECFTPAEPPALAASSSLVFQPPVIQIPGRSGMGITKGASSPTMSSTRSAGSGSCQAPKACPCSARPASNVNASGKSRWTNSSRLRTHSTRRGATCKLRRTKELFETQVISTRGRSVFTWVYAASLFIPLGSSLKLLGEWLPVVASVACLVVAASLFVLLDRWDCQSAKMPETNVIARVVITPAHSASDPRSSEDAQSANSISSSSVGDFVGPSDPTEGDPSTGSGVAL